MFQFLERIQNPSNSFKNLREELEKQGTSALPYMCSFALLLLVLFISYSGTFLSDLTFMDEGNPDTIEVEKHTLINFTKYSLVIRTIKQIQHYQAEARPLIYSTTLYRALYLSFIVKTLDNAVESSRSPFISLRSCSSLSGLTFAVGRAGRHSAA